MKGERGEDAKREGDVFRLAGPHPNPLPEGEGTCDTTLQTRKDMRWPAASTPGVIF
jgi:hypothetical protein